MGGAGRSVPRLGPAGLDAHIDAVVTALSRRLEAAGCGPLVVVGPDEGARPNLVPGPSPGAVLVLGRQAETTGTGRSELEALARTYGLSVGFTGAGRASPEGIPVGPAIPFALLDTFDRGSLRATPAGFDVLAVVTTYNEADIVEGLLDRLTGDGIRVHVVDNWSNDGTAELVAARAERGEVVFERFPVGGPSPHFELAALLGRVEEIAEGSGADWVVHHDADEIREAPWREVGLRDALYALDVWGFTCADHTVANFVPTDDAWTGGGDLAGYFGFLELGEAPGHFVQEKAWKPRSGGGPVRIAASGGHEAVFAGKRVFPYKFLTRHYPVRSQAHGEQKILTERRGRFSPAERARGWHGHYDGLGDAPRFVRTDRTRLAETADLDGPLLLQRLTGAGLPGNPFEGEGVPAGASQGAGVVAGADPAARPVVVRIQSVLFDPDEASLERFLRSLGQAVGNLTRRRPDIAVDIALGDCSTVATYDPDALERARWSFTGTGTRALYYEYFGENLGHGGAQNRLFALHDVADLLLVLNPDTVPAPGLVLGLIEAMRDGVGIVEGRQLPLEHQKGYDHERGDTSWASGACSLVRGELFGRLGGYDEATFFLYCDDVDLSWRARLAGERVVYEPSAVVAHDKRLSPGAVEMPSETEIYHSGLASLLLAWKYSRADLAEAHLVDFATSPEEIHHRVAEAFEARRAAGRLPAPIDPDHVVGDFSTYAYAPLRFDYAR